jgi:hypothetical protein
LIPAASASAATATTSEKVWPREGNGTALDYNIFVFSANKLSVLKPTTT